MSAENTHEGVDHLKKTRVLSILLCILILISGVPGALAIEESIVVPSGLTEVRVPLVLFTSGGGFAGVQYTIEVTAGVEYKSYDYTGTLFESANMVQTERYGKNYNGFISGSNSFVPESNGKVSLGTLIFTYSGNTAATIKVSEFKLDRLSADRQSTDSETFTETGSNNPVTVTYRITRGSDGNSNGSIDTGGTITAPTVEIGENETPLAILYAPFINGYPDGTVRPNGSLSRAELAQIIYNLYKSGDDTATASYTDVADDFWAYKPVAFCQDEGYMLGYPDGSFRPGRTVTRAELCTTFARIKNLTLAAEQPFTDVGDHWAKEYIGAMYSAEFINGYPDGTFRANSAITRAEAATLICRAENRDITMFSTEKTFSDLLDPDYWAYNSLMHAANGYAMAATM